MSTLFLQKSLKTIDFHGFLMFKWLIGFFLFLSQNFIEYLFLNFMNEICFLSSIWRSSGMENNMLFILLAWNNEINFLFLKIAGRIYFFGSVMSRTKSFM